MESAALEMWLVYMVFNIVGVAGWRRNDLLAALLFALPLCSTAIEGAAMTAGPPGFHFRNWSRSEGLPSNEVRAMLQTSDGYLWLSTPAGLARFDGLRFAVFNQANTPEISNESCGPLLEDDQGRLWIGTADGLLRYDGRFERIDVVKGTDELVEDARGMRSNSVTALCRAVGGGLWVATLRGVYRYREGEWLWDRGTDGEGAYAPGFERAAVLCAIDHAEHGTWVGGYECTRHRRPSGGMFHLTAQAAPYRLGYVAFQLALDPTGTPWGLFGTHDPWEAYAYRLEKGQWVRAFDHPFRNGHRPYFIFWDRLGRMWLPHAPAGLLRCDGAVVPERRASSAEHLPFDDIVAVAQSLAEVALEPVRVPFPVQPDFVICMTEDREGNYWLGTESSGLIRMRPRAVATITPENGLPDADARTIFEDSSGAVWVGSNGGLTRVTDHPFATYDESHGLVDSRVRAFAEDQEGRFWIGTVGGLSVMNPDGRFETVTTADGWTNVGIRAVHLDRAHVVWAATDYGLHRRERDVWELIGEAGSARFRMSSALLEDHRGQVWAGTHGGGLAVFRGDSVHTWHASNGLCSDWIYALHEDADGVIWIGTSAGLNRVEQGVVASLTTAHGLPDNRVNCLAEDRHGWLWVGHEAGVYRVSKRSLNDLVQGGTDHAVCIPYDLEDGLPSLQTKGRFTQPDAIQTRDGRIWIPTAAGVAVFDPDRLPDLTNAPPVLIEEVRANGVALFSNRAYGKTAPPLGRLPVATDDEVKIPPGQGRMLELDYTAPTFVAADAVRFAYRLEGLDADWIEAGPRRSAYYANLRAGRYRFQVRATTKYGVGSAAVAGFDLRLMPHLYETWWFVTSCALAVVGGVAGALLWREGYLRQVRRLERETAALRERERLARDLHDGLGGSLTRITLLSDWEQQSGLHDADRRFRQLSASTRDALHALKDIIWAAHPIHDRLESLAAHVQAHAAAALEAAGVRCEFDLPDAFPERTLPIELRTGLFYAAKEAVNNLVRHAGASEAVVRMRVEDSTLELAIEDDGRGFDLDAVERGHGLANMESRAVALGGKLDIESRPGAGTKVRLTVPLP